jgi:hypothetical protein
MVNEYKNQRKRETPMLKANAGDMQVSPVRQKKKS